MELKRTPYEAIISAPMPELSEVRQWLLAARAGDCLELASEIALGAVASVHIEVVAGRGFWARWSEEGGLMVDVGVGGLENFAAAFEFLCDLLSGAHSHFDPPAFPEEDNDHSVPLVIAIA